MIVEAPEMPVSNKKQPDPLTGRLTEIAQGYQQRLQRNPRDPEALAGMSLIAMASGQSEAAVQMAQEAVQVAPAMGPAWVTLGQALRTAKRPQEAEAAYAAAIQLDGTDPLARMGLGELKMATERAEEALRDFDLAIRRNPLLIPAQLGLGHALACLNRFEEALAQYEHVLTLKPREPEAEFSAGFALAKLGRPEEAEIHYRRAIAERFDFAAAWMNLGCLFRDQGREAQAKAALRRSVELRPDLVSGWINLGLMERDHQNYEKAEEYLQKALQLNPELAETHVAWAHLCASRQDQAGAWSWVRSALALNPDQEEAVNTWGILLHNRGEFAEAVEIFKRAEQLGSKAAASNRGNALLDMGDVEGALQAHARAVELEPHNPGGRYNLALTQLRLGDWKDGWQNYEWRWSFREVHRRPRRFQQARWSGEVLSGQRVLLHAEQGLGDTIQFCRYAALVVARGGLPILQVHEGAERLLRSLAVVRSGQAELCVLGAEPPTFDLECPLMSLPAAFGTTVETVPWTGAYLAADCEEATRKRVQFPSCARGDLRIGITWAGNPRYKADHQRSTSLETLLPLLRMPGITWISLQKGEPAEQLANLPSEILAYDGSSQDKDLAETAALMATLDLVITTDTCIPHLAGAMGKPVWMLLAHLPDWRWMRETEKTPWYPSARLIRQTSPGDWDGVIERIAQRLQAHQHALGVAAD